MSRTTVFDTPIHQIEPLDMHLRPRLSAEDVAQLAREIASPPNRLGIEAEKTASNAYEIRQGNMRAVAALATLGAVTAHSRSEGRDVTLQLSADGKHLVELPQIQPNPANERRRARPR